MKRRAAALEDRIRQLTERIRRASRPPKWKIGLDERFESLDQKINRILVAKSSGLTEIDIVYPHVSRGSVQAHVFALAPKSGQLTIADGYERFLEILDPKFVPIIRPTDELGWSYVGVQGNISLILAGEGEIDSIVFRKVRNEPCAIRKFYLILRNKGSDVYGFFTGIYELKPGVDGEQVFQLPGYIRALYVRVVVLDNWGDPDQTCFDGLYATHV
jgi:hypothetical protein